MVMDCVLDSTGKERLCLLFAECHVSLLTVLWTNLLAVLLHNYDGITTRYQGRGESCTSAHKSIRYSDSRRLHCVVSSPDSFLLARFALVGRRGRGPCIILSYSQSASLPVRLQSTALRCLHEPDRPQRY